MTRYIWRAYFFVPADQVALAADAAAHVLPGGEAERGMFGVPVSEDETLSTPSFLGCSILLTDDQLRALFAELDRRAVGYKCAILHADRQDVIADVRGFSPGALANASWEALRTRAVEKS